MKRLRIRFNAPVVLTFVFLCFIVTLAGEMTGGFVTQAFFMTFRSAPTDPLTYLRLFTHVLGHGGFEHFISNASYLLLLGPMLEEKYGSRKIVEIIVITALVTGIINYIFFWNVALCGASGVVFAFIVLTSFTGFNEGEIPITFLLVAIIFLGQQVVDGLTLEDDISNMAHILGGVIGSIAGYRGNKRK